MKHNLAVRDAIAEMNALPDINGDDSKEFQEIQETTLKEIKRYGMTSVSTALEMIGSIRKLETESRFLRQVLRNAYVDLDALFHHGQLNSQQREILSMIEKPIADALHQIEGIPAVSEHVLREGTDICDKCELPNAAGLWEQHLCGDEWRQVVATRP